LNERQLAVLRRISGGTDPVSAKNPEMATTVYALRNRGLVSTPRRGGIWVVEITDAGRFYLEHGYHPEKPQTAPAVAAPPPPPRLPDDKETQAAELIKRLSQEGGTIRVPDPDDDTRRQYRSALSIAKRRRLVPRGYHLLHTGRDAGDLIIRLESDSKRDEADWNRIRLAARDLVTDPDHVNGRLNDDRQSIDVSDPLLPRTLDLVRALADVIGRYGYQLGVSRQRRPPGLFIHARGCQFPVSIKEDLDETTHRLRIEVQISPGGEARCWADDEWTRLKDKLTAMADEFEPLAVAAEHRRVEEQRAWAAQLEEWQKEEEVREREWKTAIARARRRAGTRRAPPEDTRRGPRSLECCRTNPRLLRGLGAGRSGGQQEAAGDGLALGGLGPDTSGSYGPNHKPGNSGRRGL
jgi:hypothetical protein